MGKEKESELFWADQLAKKIIERKKYRYTEDKIAKPKVFTVKTSASLSGVLHIGRLSDTIRGDTVRQALDEAGVKTKLIWVAEDMDPLRKIPQGVPKDFEKYLGTPVSDIPDHLGCHKSYAEHHLSTYFEVLDDFVSGNMEKYSMREEYKKGNFTKYIKLLLDNNKLLIKILDKYRSNPLKEGWAPWSPICENCGKIITPNPTKLEGGILSYECKDYEFETTTATGCGHKGDSDPFKANGKLVWKSEWAAQWARWGVATEGAGKEYQVPNSAFWVNTEIIEKILNYPSPEPIFYEHLLIDGKKMSASIGNVVYPRDWLEIASPEILRFYYNKRLMKTRSFSWIDLPQLYDQFDKSQGFFLGTEKDENSKEVEQQKKLYLYSDGEKKKPLAMSFSHAVTVAQISGKEEDIIDSLKKTGHWDSKEKSRIFERIQFVRNWLNTYAQDQKFEIQTKVPSGIDLSDKQKDALKKAAVAIADKDWDSDSLGKALYEISRNGDLKPAEFFSAGYKVLLNRERGPKLAPFILAIGKEKAAKLFSEV